MISMKISMKKSFSIILVVLLSISFSCFSAGSKSYKPILTGKPKEKFIEAIKNHQPNEMLKILKTYAYFDYSNLQGNTALHIAVDSNSPDAVKILLDNGANVNAQNNQGWTPLYLSVKKDLPFITLLLLKGRANPKIGTLGDKPEDLAIRLKRNDILKIFKIWAESSKNNENITSRT